MYHNKISLRNHSLQKKTISRQLNKTSRDNNIMSSPCPSDSMWKLSPHSFSQPKNAERLSMRGLHARLRDDVMPIEVDMILGML